MLEPIGLSAVATEVYRASLLSSGGSVEELAELIGRPVELVRGALDECVRLGLIRPSWETPGRLHAISPDVALQPLLARQESDLLARQREIADTRVEVARLAEEFAALRSRSERNEVEQLHGIDRIRDRIKELSAGCERSLVAFAPGGHQTPDNREASRPLTEALRDRGVTMRTVYLDSIYNDPATVEHARWLVGLGNDVRTVASLPARMIIFDDEAAVVPMDPDNSAEGALLFRGRGILAALSELFRMVWERAAPVATGRRQRTSTDDNGLTSQESAVLRLLSEGLTDEGVARKLGVSVRTGRRITAELMARLGARSRFQAGLRAARLGWIGESPDDEGGVTELLDLDPSRTTTTPGGTPPAGSRLAGC
ncbi:LuxR family transcriptional regulator [Streptomyces actuosus]|uniref:Erythropoiesis-stimulating protein n=1 Tax=Streptomyces actuosus TaxID=1885 RepID=A0A2U9P6V5_STRAS|nr:erythropoiesis-stimulating protein [Streptomyces actuosus]MBM4821857.1 LuxR family transcriptional regulator [Streptomyces actuosus]